MTGLRWRLLDGSLVNDTVININFFGLGSWDWIRISDKVRAKSHIVLLDHWPSDSDTQVYTTLYVNVWKSYKKLTIVTGNGCDEKKTKEKWSNEQKIKKTEKEEEQEKEKRKKEKTIFALRSSVVEHRLQKIVFQTCWAEDDRAMTLRSTETSATLAYIGIGAASNLIRERFFTGA